MEVKDRAELVGKVRGWMEEVGRVGEVTQEEIEEAIDVVLAGRVGTGTKVWRWARICGFV